MVEGVTKNDGKEIYIKMEFDEFIDRLIEQKMTNTKYEITENFKKFGKREYNLMNLDCYYEDEFLIFKDDDGVLNDLCVLHSFSDYCVKGIEFCYIIGTNNSITTLEFIDGYIKIKAQTLGFRQLE